MVMELKFHREYMAIAESAMCECCVNFVSKRQAWCWYNSVQLSKYDEIRRARKRYGFA